MYRSACPKIEIVETYRHDHSLESSGGALSDSTIRFLIQPFLGEMHYLNLLPKSSVLKSSFDDFDLQILDSLSKSS
jgi:hypothetical protein